MNYLIRRIWSVWFVFLMVGILTLFFPIYYFSLLKKTYIGHRIGYTTNWLWTRLLLGLSLLPLTVHGKEKIDKKKAHLYACNHTSFLDIPICTVVVPQFFRFIGKSSLGKLPMFGYLYKKLHILVDRSDKSSRGNAVFRMKEVLMENESVCIYPEGTRISDPENRLGVFQDGGIRAAIEAQVPVVPMTILNSKKAMPDDGKFLVMPFTSIHIYFDDPIPTTGLTLADAPALNERVKAIIQKRVDDFYASKK